MEKPRCLCRTWKEKGLIVMHSRKSRIRCARAKKMQSSHTCDGRSFRGTGGHIIAVRERDIAILHASFEADFGRRGRKKKSPVIDTVSRRKEIQKEEHRAGLLLFRSKKTKTTSHEKNFVWILEKILMCEIDEDSMELESSVEFIFPAQRQDARDARCLHTFSSSADKTKDRHAHHVVPAQLCKFNLNVIRIRATCHLLTCFPLSNIRQSEHPTGQSPCTLNTTDLDTS
jgi:hypothetical protein